MFLRHSAWRFFVSVIAFFIPRMLPHPIFSAWLHWKIRVFAGALMWVAGTFVYLIHTIVITMQLLSVRGQYCSGQERTTLRDVIAAPPDEDPSDARGAAIQGTLKAVSR
jgi:hypothetical protein